MNHPTHPTWAQIAVLMLSLPNIEEDQHAREHLKEMAAIADLYNHIATDESAYSKSAIRLAEYLAGKKEETDFENHISEGHDPKNHIYWHAMNVLNRLDELPTD